MSSALEVLLDEAKRDYDSPELVAYIEKAMSTAGDLDVHFVEDVPLSECLEQARAYVEATLPSNANTIVNLYRASQLAAKLPKVEPE